MNNEEKITPEDFVAWKNDQVTKALFGTLFELKNTIEKELLSESHLVDPNIATKSARLLGQLEGLSTILEVECEDIIEE